MPDRVSVVLAVVVDEVIVTDVGLNVSVGEYPVVDVAVAENETTPVNPLISVAAMVTGGMVPPAATLRLALLPDTVTPEPLGVTEKSGQELFDTCTSIGVTTTEPLDDVPAPPVYPASPEASAGPFEPW
jgi:hypothetical protein